MALNNGMIIPLLTICCSCLFKNSVEANSQQFAKFSIKQSSKIRNQQHVYGDDVLPEPYGPDTLPCESGNQSFSPAKGTVTCGSVELNFFTILCGKGFDTQSCTIFQNNTDNTVGYYYQGAGEGISTFQLPLSCPINDSENGLAIVQFDSVDGTCTPISELYGSTAATFTVGSKGLISVTITYSSITENTTTRNGFMKLICSDTEYGPIQGAAGPYLNENMFGLYFYAPCGPTPMPTKQPTNTPQPTASPSLPPLTIEMESGMIVGSIIAGSVIILMSIGLVVWLYKRHQTRIKTGKLAASWSMNDENY